MRSQPDAMARAAGSSILWAAAAGFGCLSRLHRPRDAGNNNKSWLDRVGFGFRRVLKVIRLVRALVESGSVKVSYWTRFIFREPFGLDWQAALYWAVSAPNCARSV
jgi:hypothetical protein